MANSTQLQRPSYIICVAVKIYLASDTKVIVAQPVFFVLNIVISLFGTLLNLLVLMAYSCNVRLRTNQSTIFLLLAITDISVTAFAQPLSIVAFVRSLLGKRDCLVWNISVTLTSLFLGLSLVTIALLNLQSYITLAYPYRYQSIITKRRLKIVVIFSWLSVTAGVILSTLFKHIPLFVYLASTIITVTILSVTFTWGWTYKLLDRHRRVIQATQTPATSESVTGEKILRSTVTALVITLGLFGCYFLALVLFIQSFTNSMKVDPNVHSILQPLGSTLMFFNSLLNPCLVFWRSSVFRETAKDIFKRQSSP